jgi:hypothetical protein
MDAHSHVDIFFQNSLSQITSLALNWTLTPSFNGFNDPIRSSLYHLSNLAHLSLNLPWKLLRGFLVDLPGSLNLESLHIRLDFYSSSSLHEDVPAWKQLLESVAAVAGGDETSPVRAKKVYAYGRKEKVVGPYPDLMKKLQEPYWVKGEPPVANFEGKFTGTFQ